MRYIAILRGINVSGKNSIKMQDLRLLLCSLGFNDVETYIQSGNIVFTSAETDRLILQTKITNAIMQQFGFAVPCLVFTADYLKLILENNPFAANDPAFLHVTFLSAEPSIFDTVFFDSKLGIGEAYQLGQRAIYLYCPNGYGTTKLSNNLWELKLKIDATTRNWKTCSELLKMASQ